LFLFQFNQDGYLVLKDLFKSHEVDEMKQAGVDLTKNIPDEEKRVVFSTLSSPQVSWRLW
jgi:hypothetical protein